MANNAALPIDGNRKGVPLAPARIALARTVDATVSSSTEITLNADTTFVRCYAKTQDVYLKWGADDVTASNFDQVLPAGQLVDLVVPSGTTALNLLERDATASIIVIEF